MRVVFALILGACCALGPGCRSPRLKAAAPATRAPSASASATGGMSRAEALAQPLVQRGEGGGGPYSRRVDESMVLAIEEAVRLRLEARRKRETRCRPIDTARKLKAPTGNGDDMRGAGVDLGALFAGLEKLLRKK